MQEHTPMSLSIQREIEKHRLNIESEIDNSMGKLGFRTLLDRSGIRNVQVLVSLLRNVS